MQSRSEQAPDLNNLQRHPDHERIALARAAEAAYLLENPATPNQREAVYGVPSVDLSALRQHLAESQTTEDEEARESRAED